MYEQFTEFDKNKCITITDYAFKTVQSVEISQVCTFPSLYLHARVLVCQVCRRACEWHKINTAGPVNIPIGHYCS